MREYPIDEDYLTQCDVDIFDVAKEAIQIAMIVLQMSEFVNFEKDVIDKAVEFVFRYGDWSNIEDLPRSAKWRMYQENYANPNNRDDNGEARVQLLNDQRFVLEYDAGITMEERDEVERLLIENWIKNESTNRILGTALLVAYKDERHVVVRKVKKI